MSTATERGTKINTFRRWLAQCQYRDDPVGDLARDISVDRDINGWRWNGTLKALRNRAFLRRGQGAKEAVEEALREYCELVEYLQLVKEARTGLVAPGMAGRYQNLLTLDPRGACLSTKVDMTRADIQAVINWIPGLNDFGVGDFDGDSNKPASEQIELLRQRQEVLLASEEACSRVCGWLVGLKKIKTIDRWMSSYWLKHEAEASIGYVTNGVFIAAAIHCGFPYRIRQGGPNVCFGISLRSLKARHKAGEHA